MAETVQIIIEGTDKASGPFGKASAALAGIGTQAQKSGGLLSGFSNILSGMAATAGGFLAANALGKIGAGVDRLVHDMVDGNAQFETYNAQFTTLMGNADQAKAHIKSLTDFAAKTPFELPEVIQASRNLLTFGGAALNTRDNLTLVGNAAAATSQPIQEVSFWIGRAYNAIQNGQPWGEAAMRLQEMGILSGDVRMRLEEMAKSGQTGGEVWAAFGKSITAPKDAMDKLGQTFTGLRSTLGDTWDQIKRTLGQPIFEAAKVGMQQLIVLLNSPAVQRGVEAIADWLSTYLTPTVQAAVVTITQLLMYLGGEWNNRFVTMRDVAARIWDAMPAPIKAALWDIWEFLQIKELQIEGWLYRTFGVTRKEIIAWFEDMKQTSIKNIEEISSEISKFRRETLDPLLNIIAGIVKGKNDIGDALRILFGGGMSDAEWAKYERWGQQILQTMRDIVEIAKDVDTWLGRRGVRLPNQVVEPEAGPHGGGGGAVFGFAAGTSFAPGGAAIVGERGPELVNLPRGSSVTPNGALIDYNRLATVLAAQPIVVQIDGERVATVVRAKLQLRGAGGLGW